MQRSANYISCLAPIGYGYNQRMTTIRQLHYLVALADTGSFAEAARISHVSQPALSQQLAELRRAELVKARKAAKQVWYTLADESVEQCVSNIEAMLGGAAPTIRSGQQSNSAAPHGVASFARIL